MNKDRFLTELREYLSVLESREQDDICAEYAQHIDMKIQKGLSEEEAIRDFGSVEQLAAEILEAYHVNPEFRRQGFSLKLPKLKTVASRGPVPSGTNQGFGLSRNKDDSAQKTESVIKQTDSRFRAVMTRAAHRVRRFFGWIGAKCRAFGAWIMKPLQGRQNNSGEETREHVERSERTKEMGGYTRRFFRTAGKGIVVLWRRLAEFCIFWLKFMWNAAWLLFALICGGMAMLILAGVGAIVVFLVQGYPFIGLFMMSLGGLLCFGAMAYGSFGLLIRRKKNGGDDSRREAAGGVDETERKETESDCDNRQEEMIQKYGKEAAYGQTT